MNWYTPGNAEDQARGRTYKQKADQVRRERMLVDPEYAAEIRRKKREGNVAWEAKDPDFRKKDNARRQRLWRERHPDKVKADRERHPQHVKRKALREYKESVGCECGERDGRCLDFHHKDPKDKSFGIAGSVNLHTLEELMEEAKKCDVVCANCHRKHHN